MPRKPIIPRPLVINHSELKGLQNEHCFWTNRAIFTADELAKAQIKEQKIKPNTARIFSIGGGTKIFMLSVGNFTHYPKGIDGKSQPCVYTNLFYPYPQLKAFLSTGQKVGTKGLGAAFGARIFKYLSGILDPNMKVVYPTYTGGFSPELKKYLQELGIYDPANPSKTYTLAQHAAAFTKKMELNQLKNSK